MGVFFNKIDQKDLKPGDHIYSWRQAYLYAHHGIYLGDGMVIHFTSGPTPTSFDRLFSISDPSFKTDIPCTKCGNSSQAETNNVILSCLECFLSRGELHLFQYGVYKIHFLAQARGGTCTLASSDPTEEVLYRAIYLWEKGFGGYHFFKKNCEDFAIYCKTSLIVTANINVGGSGQASSYKAAVRSIISTSLSYAVKTICGKTLVGCGSYCYDRMVSDIGYRKDVVKVPVEKLVEMAMAEN